MWQVVSLHSIFRIRNNTTVGLDFLVNTLPKDPHRPSSRNHGCASTMKIPVSGVLQPMEECYLPIQSGLGAMLYVRAFTEDSDYLRAEKDVIRLLPWGVDLAEQEGMYTCISNRLLAP